MRDNGIIYFLLASFFRNVIRLFVYLLFYILLFYMSKKELFWAIVAIVTYAVGICAFTLAVSVHVWHILSVPTYIVTALSFVTANLALTISLGDKKGYASMMIVQGVCLLFAFSSVRLFVPVCALMTNAMFGVSLGMICLGAIGKVMCSREGIYPKIFVR